jgi:hypothetical protein
VCASFEGFKCCAAKKNARSRPILSPASSPEIPTARVSPKFPPRVFSPQIQVSILGHRRRPIPPLPPSLTLHPSLPTSRPLECQATSSPSPSTVGAPLSSPPRCRLDIHRWLPPSSHLFSNHQHQGCQGSSVLSLTKAVMNKTNQGLP